MNQNYCYNYKNLTDEEFQRIQDIQFQQLNDHHTNINNNNNEQEENIEDIINFNKQLQEQKKLQNQTQNLNLNSQQQLNDLPPEPNNPIYIQQKPKDTGYYNKYNNTTSLKEDLEWTCMNCCCNLLFQIAGSLCFTLCTHCINNR